MDMLSAMRLYARVVETRSFSKAADQLGLVASSVSRQISQLEKELGVALLTRTTRRLNITEAGRQYYEQAVQILAQVDEANRSVSEHSASPRGLIRVNAPFVFGQMCIAPLIPAFLAVYPELRVELTANDLPVDLVETGTDVAIRIGTLGNSNLVARRLVPHHRVVCASPRYLAKHGRPKTPADLVRHNCLAFKLRPGQTLWRVPGKDGDEEIPIAGNFYSNSSEAILAAARQGLGIAQLPVWMAAEDLKRGTLERLFAVGPRRARRDDPVIQAVYPRHRHLSKKVRVFIDFIAERLAALKAWE